MSSHARYIGSVWDVGGPLKKNLHARLEEGKKEKNCVAGSGNKAGIFKRDMCVCACAFVMKTEGGKSDIEVAQLLWLKDGAMCVCLCLCLCVEDRGGKSDIVVTQLLWLKEGAMCVFVPLGFESHRGLNIKSCMKQKHLLTLDGLTMSTCSKNPQDLWLTTSRTSDSTQVAFASKIHRTFNSSQVASASKILDTFDWAQVGLARNAMPLTHLEWPPGMPLTHLEWQPITCSGSTLQNHSDGYPVMLRESLL